MAGVPTFLLQQATSVVGGGGGCALEIVSWEGRGRFPSATQVGLKCGSHSLSCSLYCNVSGRRSRREIVERKTEFTVSAGVLDVAELGEEEERTVSRGRQRPLSEDREFSGREGGGVGGDRREKFNRERNGAGLSGREQGRSRFSGKVKDDRNFREVGGRGNDGGRDRNSRKNASFAGPRIAHERTSLGDSGGVRDRKSHWGSSMGNAGGGLDSESRGSAGNAGRDGYRRDWSTSRKASSSQEKTSFKKPPSRYGYPDRDDDAWPGSGSYEQRDERNFSVERNSRRDNVESRMISPRKALHVTDSTIHRAPWETGQATKRNPMIERLREMPEEEEQELEVAVEEDEDEGLYYRGEDVSEDTMDIDGVVSKHFDNKAEKSAMARIVDKLKSIQSSKKVPDKRWLEGSSDLPNLVRDSKSMFRSLDNGSNTQYEPLSNPLLSGKVLPDTRFPWEKEEDDGVAAKPEKEKRVKPPSLAELTIPEDELRRLRSLGLLARHRLKVGKAGITRSIVEGIHNEWTNSEIIRIKCEGPPALNMRRTHELLEEKTGGLVIWRAGGAVLLYRGNYYDPLAEGKLESRQEEDHDQDTDGSTDGSVEPNGTGSEEGRDLATERYESIQRKVSEHFPKAENSYDPDFEKEVEEILSSLGPAYEDWNGGKPVPVDADLLFTPAVEYKKPYRILPYRVRQSLSNTELTDLRRLARPIPPHFVLGKNRELEGLAAAIVKFWEKSEIVKIAVKRGVQNTNHERMSEELKSLTGGVLLARDKFFITLYRGKDFLPPVVAEALKEREALVDSLQEQEENIRFSVKSSLTQADALKGASTAGTLAETLEATAMWEQYKGSDYAHKMREEARNAAKMDLTRRIEGKMAIAVAKKTKADTELQKVEKRLQFAGPPLDVEHITDEEKFMFRKLGLKMKAFLLLGRRGVFDGTVENMHLHWKHRELVKVIYKAKNKLELEQTAKMLEYESGGILVASVPTSKGHAIIVYRGKNYQRPPELRPRSLLTKRQALKRSIELQRKQALELHVLHLEKQIQTLRTGLNELENEAESEQEVGDLLNEDVNHNEVHDEMLAESSPEPEEEYAGSVRNECFRKQEQLDPVFRADPLSVNERLNLRDEALSSYKSAAHFCIGKSNVFKGLTRAIRAHFKKHALVKIGVKGRAMGTSVEELIEELKKATGAVLVSQEPSKIIMYRGWPDGDDRPFQDVDKELSPEVQAILMQEDGETTDDEEMYQRNLEDEEEDGDYNHDVDSGSPIGSIADVDYEDFDEEEEVAEDDYDWDEEDDKEEENKVVAIWDDDGEAGHADIHVEDAQNIHQTIHSNNR